MLSVSAFKNPEKAADHGRKRSGHALFLADHTDPVPSARRISPSICNQDQPCLGGICRTERLDEEKVLKS